MQWNVKNTLPATLGRSYGPLVDPDVLQHRPEHVVIILGSRFFSELRDDFLVDPTTPERLANPDQ